LRKNQKLGRGGTGLVYSAELLNEELINEHGTKKVALKEIVGKFSFFIIFFSD